MSLHVDHSPRKEIFRKKVQLWKANAHGADGPNMLNVRAALKKCPNNVFHTAEWPSELAFDTSIRQNKMSFLSFFQRAPAGMCDMQKVKSKYQFLLIFAVFSPPIANFWNQRETTETIFKGSRQDGPHILLANSILKSEKPKRCKNVLSTKWRLNQPNRLRNDRVIELSPAILGTRHAKKMPP